MGNTKKTDSDGVTGQQPLPVARDYVAEVQQRAQQLAATERAANARRSEAERQKLDVQEQMARLRAEAVHARRLAEQIETVSLQDRPSPETQLMAHSSKPEQGREQARTGSAPHARGGRLAFNPLHPSMELPPEHLIRLLSLETKKTRSSEARHAKRTDHKPARQAVRQAEAMPVEVPPRPIRPRRSHAAAAHTQPRMRRKSWLLPAITVGVLLGLGASGYFFWKQPAPVPGQDTRASGLRDAPATQPRAAQPIPPAGTKHPAQPTPHSLAQKPAIDGGTSTPAGILQQDRNSQTRVDRGKDPSRQAATEAERLRLHAEAEQRFAERLRQTTAPPSDGDAAGAAHEPALPSGAPDKDQSPYQEDVTPDAGPIVEADGTADTAIGSALQEPEKMEAYRPAAEAAAAPVEASQPVRELQPPAAVEIPTPDSIHAAPTPAANTASQQPTLSADSAALDNAPVDAGQDQRAGEGEPAADASGDLF